MTSKPKVVLWRPMYDPSGHALLEAGGAMVEVVDTPDPEAVKAALPGARALYVRTPERLTAEVLDAGALNRGRLLGAGIDVVYPEPLPTGHPLLGHPKVTFSPHVAGLTVETARRLAESVAAQVLAVLRGEMPRFPVNPEAWEQGRSRRPRR
jgi:D-isomer specific 2-hydroxyacid dehydrogenase, NAD binding domain